jgi:hypothetical protein
MPDDADSRTTAAKLLDDCAAAADKGEALTEDIRESVASGYTAEAEALRTTD